MNGIIVLNKPAGRTSFEAVRAVSRLFSREKAGHAGTLDPMATGVLPVFLGRATKLLPFLPVTEKEYIASISFGVKTDTGDLEGNILEQSEGRPSEEAWEQAIKKHVGAQFQIPPMYSAIKKDGKPLYELARKGQVIDREPREITVYELKTLSFDGDTAKIRVLCSAGTYVRTLAEDLALECGCLAHLTDLKRTRACGFSLEESVTLEQIEGSEDREGFLITPESLFEGYPSVELDSNLARLFLNGFLFPISRTGRSLEQGKRVTVFYGGRLIGLGEITYKEELKKLWQTE
ncbi:MAG: tRNA pseudouridine(55) synthase TruB [Oscillospiraceae bacterium]|nr:tRNA pseudouridine(55) synthase TruB [Oscillospiraceae bacterium]